MTQDPKDNVRPISNHRAFRNREVLIKNKLVEPPPQAQPPQVLRRPAGTVTPADLAMILHEMRTLVTDTAVEMIEQRNILRELVDCVCSLKASVDATKDNDMGNWILQMVINFVLNQLSNFSGTINWAGIKTSLEAYVDKFLPSWLDPSVNTIIDNAVDAIAAALADSADLAAIVADLQAKDWGKALADLEALLQKSVHPSAPAVAAACHGMKP